MRNAISALLVLVAALLACKQPSSDRKTHDDADPRPAAKPESAVETASAAVAAADQTTEGSGSQDGGDAPATPASAAVAPPTGAPGSTAALVPATASPGSGLAKTSAGTTATATAAATARPPATAAATARPTATATATARPTATAAATARPTATATATARPTATATAAVSTTKPPKTRPGFLSPGLSGSDRSGGSDSSRRRTTDAPTRPGAE
ncbi:MAG: hypothetical protein JW751_18335 [Polyangiaceae bacterium]|nr:hypothetical protein [Polyangiaceae bacterium]